MSYDTTSTNTCSRCGASSKGRTQFASGYTENFACGSVSHSDGFEIGKNCITKEELIPVALVADVAPAPAGLLGDMTALALNANVRGMTIEGVHQSVTEICKRYGLEPKSSDREKVAEFAKALNIALIVLGSKRPKISEDALDAMLDTLLDDIRNRLNITISEIQENA